MTREWPTRKGRTEGPIRDRWEVLGRGRNLSGRSSGDGPNDGVGWAGSSLYKGHVTTERTTRSWTKKWSSSRTSPLRPKRCRHRSHVYSYRPCPIPESVVETHLLQGPTSRRVLPRVFGRDVSGRGPATRSVVGECTLARPLTTVPITLSN